ncbi:MAG: hypothetical protein JXJ18_10955 [Rhodobacteraceae bacterium]|nr:hypothetical protein [Paracoccaceae bacterium]
MQYLPVLHDRVAPSPAIGSLALLVGFDPEARPELGMPFATARCERLPYALLHAVLATAPWAQYVVSPLVTEQFDAMDLANELSLGGYRGRYLVVTPALPDPALVRREIAQLAPGLSVQLIPRARH